MSSKPSRSHGSGALRAWLEDRTPAVPDAFLEHLLRPDANPVPDVEGLAEQAGVALAEALAEPGRVRTSAFRLLAADALLTYACEAAADGESPGKALEGLLRGIGDRFR